MSNVILVIGESGTGKSSSIKTLKPEETFILNVLDKPLPFKGFSKKYTKISTDGLMGNYYPHDDYNKILRLINIIDKQRLDIKNLIIDDFQYILCNEYMRRATEVGFTKFTEIAQHAWKIISELTLTRQDLNCIVLSHSDSDQSGHAKIKTIGKLLEEKVTLEGMFTTVLHSLLIDGEYKFLTQYDGIHMAKSPMEMFSQKYINNDLQFVIDKMNDYFNCDVEMK